MPGHICDWIWENPASAHNYKYLSNYKTHRLVSADWTIDASMPQGKYQYHLIVQYQGMQCLSNIAIIYYITAQACAV